ncbi:MAG: hypothetical protein JRN09_07180 [Nitrososphaerota archaeon]|nr:hypothetical protein [Nitrososphaerota archaeon]
MSRPRSKTTAEARKDKVEKALKGLGQSVYDDLDAGRFPAVNFASRSVRNIVYDKKLQQFILGNSTVRRSAGNIKHIRPFTQLLWLAFFSKKLVEEKRTSTLRDVYYSAQAFNVEFMDQAESDELITDLEVLLESAREEFNVYPEERSAIFGNLTVEYTVRGYEGKKLDLSSHPDGMMIGPALTTAEFRDTDAEMVLAIEKGGLFTRFIEEKVHEKYKAILVNTAGQPPRSTRYLLRRMHQELKLPIGILCDADPWGAHIAMVIKSGSVQRDEPIVVKDGKGKVELRRIGEFVDECMTNYGYFNDSYGNEICSGVPYEGLTVDESNRVVFKPLASAIRHRYTGPLYRLRSQSGREVVVTPNHSVFTLRNGKITSVPTDSLGEGDLLVMQRNSSAKKQPAVLIDVIKELTALRDQMALPKLYVHMEHEKSKHHNRRRLETLSSGKRRPQLANHLETSFISARNNKSPDMCPAGIWLSKDFARLLGYYVSEGRVAKQNGIPCAVELSFGLHEPEVVDDAEECIKSVFPRATVKRYVDEAGNGVNLRFGGIPTSLLFLSLCGTGFSKKHIPAVILSVEKEYVLEFLKGCFGDGYITNSGGLVWKMKNSDLISGLTYLMAQVGITASVGLEGCAVIVSGKSEVEQLVSTVLHDHDRGTIIEHLASTRQSSYLMPKSFPVIGSGLVALKREIVRHQYHETRCKQTYRRICEVVQYGREGGIDRANLSETLEHLLVCQERRLSLEVRAEVESLVQLVNSDISFDPIAKIEVTSNVDEYVYDVSVPGVERFIGGRAGLLLHNSANAAHLRDLTTPSGVWLGVWASVTGDEPVVVERDGFIRNDIISELYSKTSSVVPAEGDILHGPLGTNAVCCSPTGNIGVMPISTMIRHRYEGNLFEIRTTGGYTVKTTGNHSIQIFDPETFRLTSARVDTLRGDELAAACFALPNNQSLSELNLAELIAQEAPLLARDVFVEGIQAEEFAASVRLKYDKKTLRNKYAQILKLNRVRLSDFFAEGIIPSEGMMRLRYSKYRVPLVIRNIEQFARLMGYHAAEGGFSGAKRGSCCELTFSDAETEYIGDAQACIRDSLSVESRVGPRKSHATRIRYGGSLLAKLYSDVLGAGRGVRSKRIPFVFFNVPDSAKREFLRGCFRGDRTINYRELTRLSLKTVSRALASDMVVLLRQLNCVAYVWKSGQAYVVSCAETSSIRDLVTELCRKEVEVSSKIMCAPGQLVYSLRDEMRALVPRGGRTALQRLLFTGSGNTAVGYQRLESAFQMFEKPAEDTRLKTLMWLVKNRVVLLPIQRITNLGRSEKEYVYDLEVDNVHTFVGGLGGLVLHNSDIVKYKLPSDPLTEIDIKRLYELKADPRYKDKMWHDELDTFLKIKKKSEQEAFSRYGLSYIVDTYLPEKLQLLKSH